MAGATENHGPEVCRDNDPLDPSKYLPVIEELKGDLKLLQAYEARLVGRKAELDVRIKYINRELAGMEAEIRRQEELINSVNQ